MNSVILHISDLHVSMKQDFDGKDIKIDSYLLAEENDASQLFLDIFIEFVSEQIKDSTIYLLITGDITNRGEKIEFKYALNYLNKIIESLNIKTENILLLPGDHDLNRRDIESHLAINNQSNIEAINIAKFENFKEFYEELLNKKEFDPNKIIIDNLIIGEKLQLIAINSSYGIDLKEKEGKISIDKFEKELETYLNHSNLSNVLCCHHNILSSYENKKSGQWNIDNRYRVKRKLEESSIKYVLSGNEHTSSLEKQEKLIVSDSGALTSVNYDSAFKIYSVNIDDDISLKNNIFCLHKSNNFEKPYHWDIRTNEYSGQDKELLVFRSHNESSPLVMDILPQKPEMVIEAEETSVQVEEEISLKKYENEYYSEELYKKIKELNAFHTGHFHWSESSRAHNWIDISKLIENKDNLQFLKNAIIDVLDTQIKNENIDLIIGLGYEGNILATKAAIKYNKPYSFLPYSYRYDEHHEMENQLNFDNTDGQFKKVLIITDVVNDGRTIRKLINKRQKEFFDSVERVYVISLLYTGSSELNQNILNVDHLETLSDYTITEDDIIDKIEYYAVKKFKVEKCPYGNNFRTECLIYKDELSCVNLFYDESKYK